MSAAIWSVTTKIRRHRAAIAIPDARLAKAGRRAGDRPLLPAGMIIAQLVASQTDAARHPARVARPGQLGWALSNSGGSGRYLGREIRH